MMHVPVLGLIENFSYLKCPDCGKEIKLFGESHIEDVAAELTLPVFGKIPLDPAFAEKRQTKENSMRQKILICRPLSEHFPQ